MVADRGKNGGSISLEPTPIGLPMKSVVSSLPISTTTPAISCPSVNGHGSGLGQWPLRMCWSVPHTPQAPIFISAPFGGTFGQATSRITGSAPGPSNVVTRILGRFVAACLPAMLCLACRIDHPLGPQLTSKLAASERPSPRVANMSDDHLVGPLADCVIDGIGRASDHQYPEFVDAARSA
jgi:hypothetical protein